MADSASPKTQHDFNLAVVEAFRTVQGQIGDLQARTAALEASEAKVVLVAQVESVADALNALAGVMPEPAADPSAGDTAGLLHAA